MADVIKLKPRLPKVVIGYIHNGYVRQNFMQSVMRFMEHNSRERKVTYSVISYCGLYIASNRNEVVRLFLNTDADWLWFVDTDIEFDPDTLYKLLEVADPIKAPMVSALYFTYVGENHMLTTMDVVPMWSKYIEGEGYEVVPQVFANETQPIDACGFGCVLVHRSVFEKFPETDDPYRWFGHDLMTAFGTRMRMGEDYTFCRRATDLGIPILGHGSTCVTHLKITPLNLQHIIKHDQADIKYADPPVLEEPSDFEMELKLD